MRLTPIALALGLSSSPALAQDKNTHKTCENVIIAQQETQVELDDQTCEILREYGVLLIQTTPQIWEIEGLNLEVPCLEDEVNKNPEIPRNYHIGFETLDLGQRIWVLRMTDKDHSHSIQVTGNTVTHVNGKAITDICKSS